MPPDFDKLPLPQELNQVSENIEEKNIKSLITENNEAKEDNQDFNQNTNFENSILEKIKNN